VTGQDGAALARRADYLLWNQGNASVIPVWKLMASRITVVTTIYGNRRIGNTLTQSEAKTAQSACDWTRESARHLFRQAH
jgi:hypothetical protein